MAFVEPKETYNGKIYQIDFGKDNSLIFGGDTALQFHSFEGVMPNKPVIAFEIQDIYPDDWPDVIKNIYEDVSKDVVSWAKYCQDILGAKALALRLLSTHPDRKDKSPEEAASTVTDVLSAINIPLIILGSNHIEKDTFVLVKVAEAANGRNCMIGKAQEKNYKTITAAAMANNHKLIAMSDLDINLSKQLNILITQMGFDKENIITDPMCSALGYGLEYTYSVMERIRLAALTQNDTMMQPNILADIGMYVWKVKETQALELDIPNYGDLQQRAIAWEAVTAISMLLAGSQLLIMRHPEAIKTVETFIQEMRG